MKLVIIESPFSAPTAEGIEKNIRYARACMLDSLMRGEAPYASHLLYTQPGVLNDAFEGDRKAGMEAGWAWQRAADLIAVYHDLGVSNGMKRAIECKPWDLLVEYRLIDWKSEA